MISVKVLYHQFQKLAVDNAPTILTGAAVVGAAATAFLTGKATFKASTMSYEDIDRRAMMNEPNQTRKDVAKLVWKEYIPAAGALGTTIACIVCANRLDAKRAAALAAAYSLSEKRLTEYRDKVVEKFNPNKDKQIRDEIAQDHVTKNPPKDNQIIITGTGDVLCHDQQTGRYFRSQMEEIRKIQNNVNAGVVEVGHMTLNDLYVALGLDPTPYSDQLGWTTDKMLDIHFSAVLTDDSQPCISISYDYAPLWKGYPKGCSDDPNF